MTYDKEYDIKTAKLLKAFIEKLLENPRFRMKKEGDS